MTEHDQIRARLLAPIQTEGVGANPGLAREAEAHADRYMTQAPFVLRECRLRLLMGHIRYGSKVCQATDGLGATAYMTRMHQKLDNYLATGNAEMLIDVVNYVFLELTDQTHPAFHFQSTEHA